jgi:hypothetical protein
MNKAERDFRLKKIQSERADLETRLKEISETSKTRTRHLETKKRQILNKKESGFFRSIWSSITDPLGVKSISSATSATKESTAGLFKGAFDLGEAYWITNRIKELNEQEARLIGAVDDDDPLGIR